jgi:hypothetical protein
VLRPAFFLVPLDAVAILGLLTAQSVLKRREELAPYLAAAGEIDARNAGAEGAETAAWAAGRADGEISAWDPGMAAGETIARNMGMAVGETSAWNSAAEGAAWVAGAEGGAFSEAAETSADELIPDEYYTEQKTFTGRSEKKKLLRRRRRRLAADLLERHGRPVLLIALVALLTWNPAASPLIESLSNREIYANHLGDALRAGKEESASREDVLLGLIESDNYAKEKDGALFGVAEGRNLIVIQLESFQDFVVGLTYDGQEVTPNLNALIAGNSIYFDQFFHQVGAGNTSDAEFAINNSICGSARYFTYKLFSHNAFRGLPALLKERGYSTAVFHAYEDVSFWNRAEMYPAEGFDAFYGGLDDHREGDYHLTEWIGWGLPDSEFYKQTLPFLKELPQPFYAFVISLSNHHPFEMLEHYKFVDLTPEDEDTLVGKYLQSAAYTDWSLGLFFDGLKDAGLYYNSVFAIYGDHQGLTMEGDTSAEMERLLGRPYDFDEMLNVPLILSLPDIESAPADLRTTAAAMALAAAPAADIRQTVHTVGGQIDFLPTMAYLLGLPALDVHFGHNLLTVDEGFAAIQSYMRKGSFITDDVMLEMSRDGVFEGSRAIDRLTRERVPAAGLAREHARALRIMDASEYVLANDVLANGAPRNGAPADDKNAE